MDPVKIVIFVAAFLALLLLGRKLSSFGESSITPVAPYPDSVVHESVAIAVPRSTGREPAVIGSDLPLPIHVPEIKRDADGRYNRPDFLNYYFEETDLVRGPENPSSFYDEFYFEARDIENNHTVLYKYFVATPVGLQKAMDDEHLPALYLEGHAIIVPRWDVPLILEMAVKDIMKYYEEKKYDSEEHTLPGDDEPFETG